MAPSITETVLLMEAITAYALKALQTFGQPRIAGVYCYMNYILLLGL